METIYTDVPSEGIHIDELGSPYLVLHSFEAPTDFSFLTIVIWLVLIVFGIGYVLNIIKLYITPVTDGKTVLRTTGIFLPFIGGIVGWF